MKTQKTLFSTSLLILLVSILLSSCVWNKRMQASKKNKHNADSIANINNNKVKIEPKKETAKTTPKIEHKVEPKVTEKVEVTLLPPTIVENNFNKSYIKATNVSWNRNTNKNLSSDNKPDVYIVNFKIIDEPFMVIYNEQGDIIETITQVLPEQLPQNIHTAIQSKYPQHTVVSAKNSKGSASKYSYRVIIRVPNDTLEKEVFIAENGKLIDK